MSPLGTVGSARPLRPEGWTVRYEYKMACFAEFRGEFEVALKWVIMSASD
jgi:trafficking protein particle complex subunit 11